MNDALGIYFNESLDEMETSQVIVMTRMVFKNYSVKEETLSFANEGMNER